MNQAERIIARFGGIRPMAAKLGIAVTTVQGWKERGTIPQPRHGEILTAAEAEGITLDAAELAEAAGEAPQRGPRRTMGHGFQTVDVEPDDEDEKDTEGAEPAEAAAAPEGGATDAAPDEGEAETVEAEEVELGAARRQTPPPVSVRTRGAGASLRTGLIGVLAGLVLAAVIGGIGWYLGGAGGGGTGAAGLAARIAAAERGAKAARGAAGDAGSRARAAEAAAKAATKKLAAIEAPSEAQAARLKAAEAQAAEAARTAGALKSDLAALEARMGAATPAGRLEAIGKELAELRARIETLAKTAGGGAGAPAAAVAENAGKIAANAQGLAANTQALAAAKARGEALETALKSEAARLEKAAQGLAARLSALERQVAASAAGSAGRGREASLVAAIGQLREAVRDGRRYADELAAVRALAKDPPARAMTLLASAAATGVPDGRGLRARFPATAVAILRAARMPAKGSWIDRAVARARSVVVIRRTGPGVAGTSPEALVARAEVQLGAGDLKGAVATLGGLDGPAAAAAKPWLDPARAHLAAIDAVAALHRAALASIGAAKPPAETPAKAGGGAKSGGAPKSGNGGGTKPATGER